METATKVKLDLKGSPDEVFLCFENEYLNPFQANVPFLHLLKTSGNVVLKKFRPATLLKQTLAPVLSCEFCEIFKKTFFHKTSPVAASIIT